MGWTEKNGTDVVKIAVAARSRTAEGGKLLLNCSFYKNNIHTGSDRAFIIVSS